MLHPSAIIRYTTSRAPDSAITAYVSDCSTLALSGVNTTYGSGTAISPIMIVKIVQRKTESILKKIVAAEYNTRRVFIY
jgi:hypothetical protein